MATVPTYQDFMEPCLQALKGAGTIHRNVITDKVYDIAGLSEEQRRQMLDSGRQTRAKSRVWWALSYLKQAGAVGNPKRGYYCITERGESLLTAPARPINNKLLKQFDEFQNFLRRSFQQEVDHSDVTWQSALHEVRGYMQELKTV